ncbi:hypothetical protein TREPR_3391 [Treponema primitia ZAS-2]|uniref:Outer membrane protein beta-barrel domain-containing protein n=1 Tax=Treponema primitia (strain ATCC BAA-887 / DSM 12427 / ZAS-2) TaxID=545694 RepID=F5YJM1_TREPZ|nr:hypothetical protein [Treponema primitia]AEF86316.1 hypothetical protein TREPR_3391 [Treponema primitia ZAS-2]
MKKIICACILFLSSVLAFSQTRIGAAVFVDVSKGTPEELRFFDRNLRMEVIAAGYTVTDNILSADYALTCSINNAASRPGQVLELTLFDVEGETDIVSTDLAFAVKEDTYETLQPVLRSMFASAPLKEVSTELQIVEVEKRSKTLSEPPDAWKSRWVFLNIRAGISSRYYMATADSFPSTSIITFDVGLEPEIHVLNFLALQLGLDIALDRAEYQRSLANPTPIVYSTSVLSIPLMVKYIFNPTDRFTLGPYVGGYGTIPLLGASMPPPLGILAGVDFGVKTGVGVLLFDLRYSMDMGPTNVPDAKLSYNRSFITLSAGYRIGLIKH